MAGAHPHLVADVSASVPLQHGTGTQRLPLTLRNYYKTLVWTTAAILVCVAGYAIEKYLVIGELGWLPNSSLSRMFKNPAELPMRLFGIPHITIALLFMISSRRMSGAKSWAQFFGLLALGTVFCWLFYQFGTQLRTSGEIVERHPTPLALLAFYFYFLIHGFRDEAFFYKAYGEMPKEAAATHERIMVVLQALMLGLLVSLAFPAYILLGELKPEFSHPALEAIFPADWPYAARFASTFLPMAAIASVVLWRIGRKFPDGLRGFWRVHYPILTVFSVSTGIILLALFSGPWTFNFVVLMHFVAWYLFGRYSLASRPPKEPPKSTWQWMRTTRSGFTVLHLGLAAVVVLLVGVSVYAFGRQDWLELVIGSRAFYYWTIMHVTLSFFPR